MIQNQTLSYLHMWTISKDVISLQKRVGQARLAPQERSNAIGHHKAGAHRDGAATFRALLDMPRTTRMFGRFHLNDAGAHRDGAALPK